MITVFGGQTSRSLRVVWLMEEMGLNYRVRHVDMLSDVEDTEWLAVNPGNVTPAHTIDLAKVVYSGNADPEPGASGR